MRIIVHVMHASKLFLEAVVGFHTYYNDIFYQITAFFETKKFDPLIRNT